jgi:hypothetical protein
VRSKYHAMGIRNKRVRQRLWSTSLTIQGQARSTALGVLRQGKVEHTGRPAMDLEQAERGIRGEQGEDSARELDGGDLGERSREPTMASSRS